MTASRTNNTKITKHAFPISQWQFDYQNQSIRIPVLADLSFTFGSQPISQQFPTNGVYEIQFSPDWNSIASVTRVADLTMPQLKPATLPNANTANPNPNINSDPNASANRNHLHYANLDQPTNEGFFCVSRNIIFFAVGLTPTLLVMLAVTFYIKKKKIRCNTGKV